jgi:hypothetical protein
MFSIKIYCVHNFLILLDLNQLKKFPVSSLVYGANTVQDRLWVDDSYAAL